MFVISIFKVDFYVKILASLQLLEEGKNWNEFRWHDSKLPDC